MTATNRTLRARADLDGLAFDPSTGLLPVVAQDVDSGDVLMLAYANLDALTRTLETGEVHFWSRSRATLWKKGETSGNVLRLTSLHADCDADAVIALVRPDGPACHTGDPTCFGGGAQPAGSAGVLARLDRTLADRARARPEGSYTVRLLDDANLRTKKLGEECAELIAALATGDRERAVEETADLLYHALVALRAEGVGVDDVLGALARREG